MHKVQWGCVGNANVGRARAMTSVGWRRSREVARTGGHGEALVEGGAADGAAPLLHEGAALQEHRGQLHRRQLGPDVGPAVALRRRRSRRRRPPRPPRLLGAFGRPVTDRRFFAFGSCSHLLLRHRRLFQRCTLSALQSSCLDHLLMGPAQVRDSRLFCQGLSCEALICEEAHACATHHLLDSSLLCTGQWLIGLLLQGHVCKQVFQHLLCLFQCLFVLYSHHLHRYATLFLPDLPVEAQKRTPQATCVICTKNPIIWWLP